MRHEKAHKRAWLASVFFCVILPLLLPDPAFSRFDGPLQSKNQFPLTITLGQPFIEKAVLEDSFSANISYSSIFLMKKTVEWEIRMDMEIAEANFRLKKTFRDSFEAGIDIPLLVFTSGTLDAPLENFHQTFEFNDFGRRARPKNEFLYSVRRNEKELIRARNGRAGIGDIRLGLKKALFKGDPAMSLRLDIDLPTGSAERGFGNGNYDLGLLLLLDKRLGERFFASINAGYVFPGDIEALESVDVKSFYFLGGAIEAIITKRLNLVAQLSMQESPFPEIGRRQIDDESLLVVAGARYGLEKSSFELAIAEDLNTAGAPDVTVNLTYKKRF